jgi:hypothetical protein
LDFLPYGQKNAHLVAQSCKKNALPVLTITFRNPQRLAYIEQCHMKNQAL